MNNVLIVGTFACPVRIESPDERMTHIAIQEP